MEGGPDKPGRRWALGEIGRRVLGVAGVAAGLGRGESAAQSPDRQKLERERAIERELAAYQQHIRSNYDKLSTGDPSDVNAPLRVALGRELRVTPAQLEGTKFDIRELENKYPFMITTRRRADGKVEVALIPPGAQYTAERVVAASDPQVGYATGFFLADDTFITNAHVFGPLQGDQSAWLGQPRDVAVFKLPQGMRLSQEQREHIIPREMFANIGAEEISGLMGVCVGADPDQTADVLGNKTYLGGIVSTVPTKLRESFERATRGDYFNRFLTRSVVMRIPRGESVPRPEIARGGTIARPAAGKSGSPMFVWHRGGWKLGGIFWGVDTVGISGTEDADAGFSIGVNGIDAALAQGSGNHYTLPQGVEFKIHSRT